MKFEDSMSFLIGMTGPLQEIIKYNWDNGIFRQNLGWLLLQHKIFLDAWRCGMCEFALNNKRNKEQKICQECLCYINYKKRVEKRNEKKRF